MRRIRTWLAISLFVTGCSSGGESGHDPVGKTDQPIINGSPDNHTAVVAVLWSGGNELTECTGTIIATNGTTGYVLTAGHCCPPANPPQVIVANPQYIVGQNFGQPSYPVTNYLKNPAYTIGGDANQEYDFCMVTFAGVANMPVIPAMTTSTDNVQAGQTLTQVGYGQTVRGPEGSDNNVNRNEVAALLKGFESSDRLQAVYSENPGGTCFGDSGGPDLATGSDGLLEVFGVHSNVSGNCDQNGQSVSGVVSGVYDDFIVPYINGTQPMENCNECAAAAENNGCLSQVNACDASPDCVTLAQCINGCAGNQTCVNQCAAATPAGLAPYNAINTCICTTACVSECSAECATTSSTGTSGTSSTGTFMPTSGSTTTAGVGGAGVGSGIGTSTEVGAGGAGVGQGGSQKSGSGGSGSNNDSNQSGGCSASGQPVSEWSPFGGLALGLALITRRRRRTVG